MGRGNSDKKQDIPPAVKKEITWRYINRNYSCWRNRSWDWTSSKKQKKYYSGKKKRHTLKIQIVADEKKKDILNIAFSGGNKHDFRLYKESRPVIPETTFIIADKGYQGISDIHFSSLTPVKAAKNYKLNYVEKAFNSDLSKRRIFIEHITAIPL